MTFLDEVHRAALDELWRATRAVHVPEQQLTVSDGRLPRAPWGGTWLGAFYRDGLGRVRIITREDGWSCEAVTIVAQHVFVPRDDDAPR